MIARRFSTREVRARIWQALGRHLLPLLLVLALVSLPQIIAGALKGQADVYTRQAKATRAEMLAMFEANPDGLTQEQNSLLIAAWAEEAQLDSQASTYDLIAAGLHLLGFVLCPALLMGVNLVLITILRGGDFRWSDGRISFREFRRALSLQLYIAVMLTLCELPGFLMQRLGANVDIPWLRVTLVLAGTLLALTLGAIARLRYQLAPRLLADGAEGTAGELLDLSTEILDVPSLLPMASILFPGLLMLLGASLAAFGLRQILPLPVAGALEELLYLPGWAYLMMGSAAIYTTFRTEE